MIPPNSIIDEVNMGTEERSRIMQAFYDPELSDIARVAMKCLAPVGAMFLSILSSLARSRRRRVARVTVSIWTIQ